MLLKVGMAENNTVTIIEKYNDKGYKKLLRKFIIKYKCSIQNLPNLICHF